VNALLGLPDRIVSGLAPYAFGCSQQLSVALQRGKVVSFQSTCAAS